MTKEEAMRIAMGLRTDFKCESDTMVDFCNTVIKVIEQTTWIPVSERLPEEDGTYFVTAERMVGKPIISIGSFAKDLNKVDEDDFPINKCGWYNYDCEFGYWEDTTVIAWMPKPEIYKAEWSDKE